MDFDFSEEQRILQRTVRDMALREITPRAQDVDRTGEFPWHGMRKAAEHGLLGIPIPAKYGGAGSDMVSYAIAVEELARACANTGFVVSIQIAPLYSIYIFGTEEQKLKYLVPLASGKRLGAFALTEPTAGSDAAAIQTTAVLDGSEYVLNGTKCFITNASYAEVYVVFAVTERGKGTKGISAFIVEKGLEGFTFGKIEDKVGLRASANGELIFNNCRVAKENLLGKEGDGFRVALTALDRARVGGAAIGVGIAQAALDAAKRYSKERVQFGQTISSFQAIQFMVADMATDIDAARLLTYRAANLADKGGRFTREAAMAKLHASEVAMRVTVNALQVYGGYGLSREHPLERHMRDAKALAIIEGTSEIQKLIISREELR